MLLRTTAFLIAICSAWCPAVFGQQDKAHPDFAIQQDKATGLWGIVDGKGKEVVAARYARLSLAGSKTAIGFKPEEADAYVVGTGGRVKRIGHEEYFTAWKAAVAKSDIPDRELILRVLEMYKDPLQRLPEMANIEATYADMADVRKEVVRTLMLKE